MQRRVRESRRKSVQDALKSQAAENTRASA
jgi:hypothetical protein